MPIEYLKKPREKNANRILPDWTFTSFDKKTVFKKENKDTMKKGFSHQFEEVFC